MELWRPLLQEMAFPKDQALSSEGGYQPIRRRGGDQLHGGAMAHRGRGLPLWCRVGPTTTRRRGGKGGGDLNSEAHDDGKATRRGQVTPLHTSVCPNENPLDVTFHRATYEHETAGGGLHAFPKVFLSHSGGGLEAGMHGLGGSAPLTGITFVKFWVRGVTREVPTTTRRVGFVWITSSKLGSWTYWAD
jgi:hypothetical protein